MDSVSACSRIVLMSGGRLLFTGMILFILVLNLCGAGVAQGGGLNLPAPGSASVPFGSPASIDTITSGVRNGFPVERSLHVEDQIRPRRH